MAEKKPQKDPAALFFIDKWLVATKGMKADARGWFLNLILYQFDKQVLPNDLEELANLADVRYSEFNKWAETWQHVLSKKFTLLPDGTLRNEFAAEIIRAREEFKQQRSISGKISAFMKFVRKQLGKNEPAIEWIRKALDVEKLATSEPENYQHMFQHMLKKMPTSLNVIVNVNTDTTVLGWGTGKDVPITHRMIDIFQKSFPGYPVDQEHDLPACLGIAQKIAKLKGWPAEAITNGKMEATCQEWELLTTFCAADDWYKSKSITFLHKNFQSLIQAKNGANKSSPSGSNEQPASGRNIDKYQEWINR